MYLKISFRNWWIMHSLNDVTSRLDKIENRLHRVERSVWIASGGIVVIGSILWLIFRAVLSAYDFSITPKP